MNLLSRKSSVKSSTLRDIMLLMYLCAMAAHNLGSGTDYYIARISFIGYFCVECLVLFRRKVISFDKLTVWYIVFLLINILSVIWAKNSTLVFYHIPSFFQIIFLLFFLSQRVKRIDDVIRIIELLLGALVYMVFLLYIRTPVHAWGTERVGSALGMNPNSIGMMCSTGCGFCLYFFVSSKVKLKRIIFLVMYVVLAGISLLSGSRKAIGIILAITVLFFSMIQKRGMTQNKILRRVAVYTLIALSVYWLIDFVMTDERLYYILGRRLESILNGGVKDVSITERNFFIDQAIYLFSMHPIIGYGSNNFAQYMYEISYSHQVYSHNNFVELLATLGIVGFIAYYWLPARVLYVLYKKYRENNQDTLVVLMLIILGVSIVFGWWNVNYMSVFSQLLYGLAFFTAKLSSHPINSFNILIQGALYQDD